MTDAGLRPPWRIGVVAPASLLPWKAFVIRELASMPSVATVECIGSQSSPAPPARAGIVWRMVNSVEERVAQRRWRARWPDAAFDPSADRVPLDDVLASRGPATLESASPGEYDLILQFAPSPFDRLAEIARLGVVTADTDGEVDGSDCCVPGLDGYLDDLDFTEVRVRRCLPGSDRERTSEVDRGSIVTSATLWSVHRWQVETKAAMMVLDVVRRLERMTARGDTAASDEPVGRATVVRPPTGAGLWTTARSVVTCVRRFVRNHRGPADDRLQWRLLFGPGGTADALPARVPHLDVIEPPPGRYWADPFVVVHDEHPYVFFEDFDMGAEIGRLAVGRWADGELSDVRTVFEPDHHLSFPFIFDDDGELYMIPESSAVGRIDLYRSTSFPTGWEHVRVLLDDVQAVDSAVVRYGDRYWLFTNIDRTGRGDFSHELHVFSSDDLLVGEFAGHPLNPVVTDARQARMGGALVERSGGGLLRAAQLGGRQYGSALRMVEIEELTADSYSERVSETVRPDHDDDVCGIHHVSFSGGWVAMDACFVLPRQRARIGLR